MTAETQRLRRLDLRPHTHFSDGTSTADAVLRTALAKGLAHIVLQEAGNTKHGVQRGTALHVPTDLINHSWTLMS